jgi:hypothetical protein
MNIEENPEDAKAGVEAAVIAHAQVERQLATGYWGGIEIPADLLTRCINVLALTVHMLISANGIGPSSLSAPGSDPKAADNFRGMVCGETAPLCCADAGRRLFDAGVRMTAELVARSFRGADGWREFTSAMQASRF